MSLCFFLPVIWSVRRGENVYQPCTHFELPLVQVSDLNHLLLTTLMKNYNGKSLILNSQTVFALDQYQSFVGRHPHADRRGLQPASADALFGGKGLPPYFYQVNEGSNYHKALTVGSGLRPEPPASYNLDEKSQRQIVNSQFANAICTGPIPIFGFQNISSFNRNHFRLSAKIFHRRYLSRT